MRTTLDKYFHIPNSEGYENNPCQKSFIRAVYCKLYYEMNGEAKSYLYGKLSTAQGLMIQAGLSSIAMIIHVTLT